MQEAVVEIVYSLDEEDILHHVRRKLGKRSKDPLLRTRVAFIASYCVAGAAAVTGIVWAVMRPQAVAANTVSAFAFMVVACGVNGYRSQKAYRRFYQTLDKTVKRTDCLVLRANRQGFSITRPGISESSVNWTAIEKVNMTADFLYLYTRDEQVYRVPSRYISPEQKEALVGMLREMWQDE